MHQTSTIVTNKKPKQALKSVTEDEYYDLEAKLAAEKSDYYHSQYSI
ncbi:MAG: hypothetical protein KME64_37555 [Scytonematopsis contorta HA4267-MV1]|jgi:hypothetical protein|nr:hypothetical protein [Scytonematopsis contorta HA4267-MV1]MBW4512160.1 hypothetical protein [Scytonematopsis contorta HA4267-MV1]